MNYAEQVNHLPIGDYAEVGVYKGDHAALIAEWMIPNTGLWLFDSFQGHGEPSDIDRNDIHPKGRYSDTDMETVRSKVKPIMDAKHGHLWIVPGYVSMTFNKMGCSLTQFRFVRIDMDHYLPTRLACEFFRYRMVPGGIMEFDDYLVPDCPGATKAVDEVFGPDSILLKNSYCWIAP